MKQAGRRFFCTFADSRMHRSLKRIRRQAEAIGVYDRIYTWDESNLDPGFRERFKEKLTPTCRGFGYWIWKPQIMLQVFREMNDGDIVHYCDAGCWVNPDGKARLLEYFDMAEESGALAFQVKNTFGDSHLDSFSLPESAWTKGDVFDYFGVRDRTEITRSQQIGAGIFLLRKSCMSNHFLQKWMEIYEKDFSLADDSPSRSPNFPDFIEHRHDQSLFGILCKLNKIKTLSTFEYFYPSVSDPLQADWSKLKMYPIWAKRDKDLGLVGGIKDKVLRRFSSFLR